MKVYSVFASDGYHRDMVVVVAKNKKDATRWAERYLEGGLADIVAIRQLRELYPDPNTPPGIVEALYDWHDDGHS